MGDKLSKVSARNNSKKSQKKAKEPKKGKRLRLSKMHLIAVSFIGLLVVSGVFFFLLQQAREEVRNLSDPEVAAREETAQLTKKVGELIELPTEETPTIATVVDASKLQDQAFFARAENGDRVLMYSAAKKAILYRPSIHKIIEVAPINIGDTAANEPAVAGESTKN